MMAALVSCKSSDSIHFDIPKGNASQTLLIYAEQSKTEIMFDLKKPIITKAAKGKMDKLEALEMMIKGTPLIYEIDVESGAIGVMESM